MITDILSTPKFQASSEAESTYEFEADGGNNE